jgi:putative transposase
MKRTPRPVLRAPEALAQSPINTSALAMAAGQDFAHDTLYRALNQPLALCFERSLGLCKGVGGLDRGCLLLDDLLIRRAGPEEGPGHPTGAWVSGLSLVVLAWAEGKRRIPPAFLPYFEESRLARLGWAKAAGLRRGCSLTPGTRRSGSMPTAGLLSRGSGPTVCWRVFSAGGMGAPVG